ncbi:MAG: hypothetical protein ACJAS1_000570 [Oleiphilaceae bacterium]|jgi:hypothetical protein
MEINNTEEFMATIKSEIDKVTKKVAPKKAAPKKVMRKKAANTEDTTIKERMLRRRSRIQDAGLSELKFVAHKPHGDFVRRIAKDLYELDGFVLEDFQAEGRRRVLSARLEKQLAKIAELNKKALELWLLEVT